MEAIETILDLEVPDRPRISPNGKQVVYSTSLLYGHKKGDNALSSIWLADVGKESSTRQLTSGLFKDSQATWSPDSSSIAFISDRAKPGKSSAIYQLSLKGGEASAITKAENESSIAKFAYSADGKFIAYLSTDEKTPEKKAKDENKDDVMVYGEDWDLQRLRLVHVSTKVVDTIISRDDHISDFVWNGYGNAIAFLSTKTPEIESPIMYGSFFEFYSLSSKQTKEICKAPRRPGNSWSGGMRWLNDDLYLVANANAGTKMDSDVLYKISVQSGTWTKLAGGEVDCASGHALAGDKILVRVMCGLGDEIRTLDGKVLYAEDSNLDNFDACSSSAEITLAFAKSTLNKPTEVYSLSHGSTSPTQLSNHGQSIPDPIGVVKPLSIKSSDGQVTLEGIYVAPKTACGDSGKPTKPLPTFVQVHGGPYWRFSNMYYPDFGWVQFILRAGYAVMLPNYRGSSGRGTNFANQAQDPGVGTKDYEDVIALTQHCVESKLSDPEKLMTGGWSQGGFMAYISAVRNGTHGHGWKWRACIAGAGVTDQDAMAMTSDVPIIEAELAGGVCWMQQRSDISNRKGSAIWEFAEAAKAKRIPDMLILHGKEDVRVPVTQAWAFHRGCQQWNIPCEMVTYPRAGHVLQERKQFVDMYQRVVRFCDTHFT